MKKFVQYVTPLMVLFGLAACQTTSPTHWAPIDVTGTPLGPNDLMLVNIQMQPPGQKCTNMRVAKCRNTPRERLVAQFRFNGHDFAYRVAWAPHNMAKPSLDTAYVIRIKRRPRSGPKALTISAVDFTGAELVTSATGDKYWLSQWIWNPATYKGIQQDENYLGADYITREDYVGTIWQFLPKQPDGYRGYTANIDLDITVFTDPGTSYHSIFGKRNVLGEDALKALAEPEKYYEMRFAEMDAEFMEEVTRKANAEDANIRYRRFVNTEYRPLTVNGLMNECPGLPGRMKIGYNPPEEFYQEGDNAMRRANCIDRLLQDYDPETLIAKYEATLDREAELFAETYDIERFSLEEALDQTDAAEKQIPIALARAEWYYDGGDETSDIYARKRREKQQQRAAAQSLMQSLQQMQSAAQQQYEESAARVRALQRQGIRNYNRQRRAANSSSRPLPQPRPVRRQADGDNVQIAASSSDQAQQTVSGNLHTVYMATDRIRSLRPAGPFGCIPDTDLVSTERQRQTVCTGRNQLKMYLWGSIDPARCKGESGDHNFIEATVGQTIGTVNSIEHLTEGEARRLVESGNVEGPHSAIFYRADKVRAESALTEHYYRKFKPHRVPNTYYKDRTEIIGIARNNQCDAVHWLDYSTGQLRVQKEKLSFN